MREAGKLKGDSQLLMTSSIADEQMVLPEFGMLVLGLGVLTSPSPEESWSLGKEYG